MAIVGNAPATLDWVVRQGSDASLTLTVDTDGTPFDFTGATVTARVLNAAGAVQAAAEPSVTTATGELVLVLSDTQTALVRSGWRWYVDVTVAGVTQPWVAGVLSPVAKGQSGRASSTATLSIITDAGATLTIAADPGQGLAAHVAAADPHPGYVLESVLTTAGDLLTRGASAPDRVTRASLAQDTAFSSRYVPSLADLTVTRNGAGQVTSVVEAGITTSVTRNSAEQVATVTHDGTTKTISRDSAGQVTGVA